MKLCGGRKLQYTIPLPARFIGFLRGKSVKTVLELGCGYGRACFFLRENGLCVAGVDLDRVQVRLALQEAKSRRIRDGIGFVVSDAGNLCFADSSFDAVTMLGILTLVPKAERPRIMSEVERVLKHVGYVFIEEFGRTWENPVYRKRYKEDLKVTGELGTFAVKDDNGRVLLFAHHFARRELLSLLRGFQIVSFEKDVFTSYYHRNWVKGNIILAQKRRR
jgi:ubiquinone/menaquinone biosynthesis C-methylase UbiE